MVIWIIRQNKQQKFNEKRQVPNLFLFIIHTKKKKKIRPQKEKKSTPNAKNVYFPKNLNPKNDRNPAERVKRITHLIEIPFPSTNMQQSPPPVVPAGRSPKRAVPRQAPAKRIQFPFNHPSLYQNPQFPTHRQPSTTTITKNR